MDRVENRDRVEYFGKETKLEKCTCILYILLYVSHLKLGHKRDETDAERMG